PRDLCPQEPLEQRFRDVLAHQMIPPRSYVVSVLSYFRRKDKVSYGRDKNRRLVPADLFSMRPKILPIRVHGPSGIARRGSGRSGERLSVRVHGARALEARE